MGKLLDDVGEMSAKVWAKLEEKCPICGLQLDTKRHLGHKHFLSIECPQCHVTIEVGTRNNHRVAFVILCLMPLTFALGLLVSIWF